MSEKEFSDVKTAAEIYKDLRGKIDGYAEAVKESRTVDEAPTESGN